MRCIVFWGMGVKRMGDDNQNKKVPDADSAEQGIFGLLAEIMQELTEEQLLAMTEEELQQLAKVKMAEWMKKNDLGRSE